MRKKLLAILCICLCILSFVACGTDPKQMDYNGMTYEELEQSAIAVWESLKGMEVAQMEAIIAEFDAQSEAEQIVFFEQYPTAKSDLALMRSWVKIQGQIGEYVDTESFTVTKTGKTTTADLVLNYENKPIIISVVYKNRDMSVESTTVDLVYTLGEKMQNAALNTVMGMGTVFLMLIIISLCISSFSFISKLESKLKEKNTLQLPEEPEEVVPEDVEETDDLELVAVIAAAIAEATGQSTDDFVVRSIRRR